jgi:TDG/mug DNA glycosylase family protein
VRPGLEILFCGINPGRTSAALGHHFARPGNRFWPVLHRAGFTPKQLDPSEDGQLLVLGYGLTNLVMRTTARADELSVDELRAGARRLERELVALAPRVLAVLGVGAYRQAFGAPAAKVGKQGVALGHTAVWVLPNPSGLNAHYPMPALVAAYRQL